MFPTFATGRLAAVAIGLAATTHPAAGDCIANADINNFFADLAGGPIPQEGSCCQLDVCGIPCPAPVPSPSNGYGIAIGIAIAVFCVIGFTCYFLVRGDSSNFFVAGRTLPLFVCALTLASQSLDSNALLGNADLAYKYHFYDGMCLPLGLALSLFLNGIFLARHINKSRALTLPEIYGHHYGPATEVLVAIISCCSFIALLAGNLVGMSAILGYVYGLSLIPSVFISGAVMLVYTLCGGLFSVAYSDVVQSLVGISGCLVTAIWFMQNSPEPAPPPSIGMPKPDPNAAAGMYIYPDNIGDGGICDEYKGVPCENDPTMCCYNQQLWCPSDDNCTADNGAYPIGDQRVFSDQMTNAHSLSPFPNAVFFNWATIFVLAFGNLAALDFQARNLAAKTEMTATIANLIAGSFTLIIGIPFAFIGAIARYYYGPDSIHAEFDADTCSSILDLPQCGAWVPDGSAVIKLLVHQAPPFIGAWCLIAIVAASMSTSDGAILALGTVGAHNIARKFPCKIDESNLLQVARWISIPLTLAACLIASFFQLNHSLGATGYLLIVAFDIMLAGCIAPLFMMFYMKDPSPNAGFLSVFIGSLVRVILEFSLPKDGFLLLPFSGDEYLNYGPVSSDLFPGWFDVPSADKWDPSTCEQERFRDFTGVDSLVSPVVSLIVFLAVHYFEKSTGANTLAFLPKHWMEPVPERSEESDDDAAADAVKGKAAGEISLSTSASHASGIITAAAADPSI